MHGVFWQTEKESCIGEWEETIHQQLAEHSRNQLSRCAAADTCDHRAICAGYLLPIDNPFHPCNYRFRFHRSHKCIFLDLVLASVLH